MLRNLFTVSGRVVQGIPQKSIFARIFLAGVFILGLAACDSGQRHTAASVPPDKGREITCECCGPKSASERTDSIMGLRGQVVLAHEVRAFVPEGDTTEYWIVDRSGTLERAYDSVTGGQKNGQPVRAELKVRYTGPSDEGFAADYEGVFEVVEVLSVEKAE